VFSNAGPVVGDARTSFAVRRVKGVNLRDAHDLFMDGVVETDRSAWSRSYDGVQLAGDLDQRREMSKSLARAEFCVMHGRSACQSQHTKATTVTISRVHGRNSKAAGTEDISEVKLGICA